MAWNDKWYALLGEAGFKGALNDRLVAFWKSLGFRGAYNDLQKKWEKAGSPSPSEGALIALQGSGYSGSLIISNVVGTWIVGGVPVEGEPSDTLLITPEMEGKEIYQEIRPWITFSDGGYAGSTYQANMLGLWYADDVLVGEASTTWEMTPEHEGKEISLEVVPLVWIESGSGYSGSVLRTNAVGQWYVGEEPVGELGAKTLRITPEMEGKEIYVDGEIEIVRSNTIQMFAPVVLPPEVQTGGGHWGADTQLTTTREGVEYVTSWPNRLGGVAMTQEAAVSQPLATTFSGYPAALWEKSPAYQYLSSPEARAYKWGIAIVQFASGTETATTAVTGSTNYTYLVSRGAGTSSSMAFFASRVTSAGEGAAGIEPEGVRKGGDTPSMTGVLPLPLNSISWKWLEANQTEQQWGVGLGYNLNQNRQWVGPILAVVMLNVIPDDATRQQIEGYLHWKYGIQDRLPANHLYKNNPPRLQ